jgi:hypothetical protein
MNHSYGKCCKLIWQLFITFSALSQAPSLGYDYGLRILQFQHLRTLRFQGSTENVRNQDKWAELLLAAIIPVLVVKV